MNVHEEAPRKSGEPAFLGAEDPARIFAPLVAVRRPFMRSPKRGADTAVYPASFPGRRRRHRPLLRRRKAKTSSKASQDRHVAARLW